MSLVHVCSKCSLSFPYEKFQLRKGIPSGQCRSCKTESMKAKRKKDGISVREFSSIIEGRKLCMHCKVHKELSEFSPSIRGLSGVSAYCKPCAADRYRNKENAVRNTAKYRLTNRAVYLANHRMNMFKRKSKIKVTDDGTVTKDFLNTLYETETCYYCEQEVLPDKRTADHKVALIRGGLHSAANLVMACFTCNSSKRDLPEIQFKEKLKNEGKLN